MTDTRDVRALAERIIAGVQKYGDRGLRLQMEELATAYLAADTRTTELEAMLRYLRPALPVLRTMLVTARMDGGKAEEMMAAIDAVLTDPETK